MAEQQTGRRWDSGRSRRDGGTSFARGRDLRWNADSKQGNDVFRGFMRELHRVRHACIHTEMSIMVLDLRLFAGSSKRSCITSRLCMNRRQRRSEACWSQESTRFSPMHAVVCDLQVAATSYTLGGD